MKRKLIFILAAGLLLFPWKAAYAYDDVSASTGQVSITSAETTNLPAFNVFGSAIGSVTQGDIFFIDSTGNDADSAFMLSLTNTDELIHDFRYMTLNIGIYTRDEYLEWKKTPQRNGDIYLTMQNGAVDFSLAGGAVYRVTIEKGCYKCYGTNGTRNVALPDFYLTAY